MTECPICLETIDDEDLILLECCQMKFCTICLPEWFRQSGNVTCPICHKMLDEYYIPITDVTENTDENTPRNTNTTSLKLTAFFIVIFILVKMYCSFSDTR